MAEELGIGGDFMNEISGPSLAEKANERFKGRAAQN